METFMANTVLFAQMVPARIVELYADLPADQPITWINNPTAHWIGIWIAALLTFAMYSFLYKDNVVYKFAEHLYVGISVGYFICITWFNVMKPNLYEPLFTDFSYNKILIIPALFGISMLFRLSRQYWPDLLSVCSSLPWITFCRNTSIAAITSATRNRTPRVSAFFLSRDSSAARRWPNVTFFIFVAFMVRPRQLSVSEK